MREPFHRVERNPNCDDAVVRDSYGDELRFCIGLDRVTVVIDNKEVMLHDADLEFLLNQLQVKRGWTQ